MNAHLPIYQQIEALLKQKIAHGEYCAGQALPSERTLAELYGVNRLTIRAALKQLQIQNLVVSVHGKGNFVCATKLRKHFSNFAGFGADIKSSHFEMSNQVIIAQPVSIGYEISQKMQLPEGTTVFRLMRLRQGNGQPVALEDAYIPLGLIPNIETVDFCTNSLYAQFESNGLHLNHSRQLLATSKLNPYLAELMGLPSGSGVYRVEYITYDRENRLVEFTISHMNPRLSIITSHLR